jgi:flagellar protein FliJ
MRFEFPLERLLKVKRQLERLVEMEQARAAMAVAEARDRVEGLKNRLRDVSTAMQGSIVRGVMPGNWDNVYAVSEHLGHEIERAEGTAKIAEEKLAAVAKKRTAAATEVEVLASIRGERWEEWQQKSAAKAQEQLDEVTMRRWMLAKASREGAA